METNSESQPKCGAHNTADCAMCKRTLPDGLDSDGKCYYCYQFDETGMHDVCCPHRDRSPLPAVEERKDYWLDRDKITSNHQLFDGTQWVDVVDTNFGDAGITTKYKDEGLKTLCFWGPEPKQLLVRDNPAPKTPEADDLKAHVEDLEMLVKDLEAEIAELRPYMKAYKELLVRLSLPSGGTALYLSTLYEMLAKYREEAVLEG